MKRIGLIGGMSWQSSLEYYRIINEQYKQKFGGLRSAEMIMYSLDFEQIEKFQRMNCWDEAADALIIAAQGLEAAGADFVLICANTMHKVAEQVNSAIRIPLLHIVDSTAEVVTSQGLHKVGLLGTKFTMEQDFYKHRLHRFGLEVLVPDEPSRSMIHRIIFEELCQGITLAESKVEYMNIIAGLVNAGAEGVILGCTEISLLIKQEDSTVPLFDTASIHALAAVDKALMP